MMKTANPKLITFLIVHPNGQGVRKESHIKKLKGSKSSQSAYGYLARYTINDVDYFEGKITRNGPY